MPDDLLTEENKVKLEIGELINDFGAEWALHSHEKGKVPDIIEVVEKVYAKAEPIIKKQAYEEGFSDGQNYSFTANQTVGAIKEQAKREERERIIEKAERLIGSTTHVEWQALKEE